jgi:Uma2 family endonuclease
MLATRASTPMSVADFLAFVEARPGEKWELIDGRPVAMAGGTVRHATISANIAEAVGPAARARNCRVLRDLFVSVAANDGQMFDPDVMIRCGPADETARSIDDPVAVFEVLSPSTMQRDRGVKLSAYMQISSLRLIAIIYSTERRVEVWSREEGQRWPETPAVFARLDQQVRVASLGFDLSLAAIYADADPAIS